MRLKTEIYVSMLTRRVFAMGGFAAIEKRGAEEAGAIFIRQRFRDGLENLYAPVPQMLVSEEGERRFELRLRQAEREAVEQLLNKEQRFDSDLWVVELEIDEIGDLFPVADAS